ncbi:MAG: puuR 2, partial [Nocardioidaceae bacterium]|nr:puuR 2 [Nocardioidaceae bacterium]
MATTDPADLVRLVGTKVRARRRLQGLTLKDISARTGLSSSMLSMLERGVANASVGTLVSVASALGVHMAELFEDIGGAPEEPEPVR